MNQEKENKQRHRLPFGKRYPYHTSNDAFEEAQMMLLRKDNRAEGK